METGETDHDGSVDLALDYWVSTRLPMYTCMVHIEKKNTIAINQPFIFKKKNSQDFIDLSWTTLFPFLLFGVSSIWKIAYKLVYCKYSKTGIIWNSWGLIVY